MWRPDMTKPPYRVPTMAEIRALPWNGLKVASTFAGGGGSSTGYRMAGCKVVYANELTESARDSYAANMAPGTVLDGRDIRTVQAEDILTATGLGVGELDIFDGSPPCVSFSTAGKREKGWGRVTTSHDATQRQDDLFHEFARLLKGLQPRAFVAENVSGLIKGTAKGYFLEILRALRACGYRVEAKLLDAQWLGVPQARQRLIFVGMRLDLDARPAFPAPLGFRYSVRDALPWITKCVHDTQGSYRQRGSVTDEPCPTITVGHPSLNSTHYKVEARMIIGNNSFKSITIGSVDHTCPTIMAGGSRTVRGRL
jgi:DNA (cytosine-5)-methyltransferase 1